MSITFQTLISSSAGNCVRITSGGATLLLDFGFKSQRDARSALDGIRGEVAVAVSHAHGDHLNYSGAKVLAQRGLPIFIQPRAGEAVASRCRMYDFSDIPRIQPVRNDSFIFCGFDVRMIPVRHAPGVATYGFSIKVNGRKLVVCTDFCRPEDIASELTDCDLIYLESNHDLELLRLHPNFASYYHLSNPKAGELLAASLLASKTKPQAIVLGHLSEERNHPSLALATVQASLDSAGLQRTCSIVAAPSHACCNAIQIA